MRAWCIETIAMVFRMTAELLVSTPQLRNMLRLFLVTVRAVWESFLRNPFTKCRHILACPMFVDMEFHYVFQSPAHTVQGLRAALLCGAGRGGEGRRRGSETQPVPSSQEPFPQVPLLPGPASHPCARQRRARPSPGAERSCPSKLLLAAHWPKHNYSHSQGG